MSNSLMGDPTANAVTVKLEQLIQLCERLSDDNEKLRAKEADWMRERTRLMEKNELARTRVEAMITRLKSLETETQ